MKKNKTKKKKTKIVLKNPKRLLIFFLIIIILIIAVTIKNNKIQSKDYLSLIINNVDVTKNLENEIIIKDNIQYLSVNDIKKCLDENIYIEKDKIITSSEKKIAVLELDSNNIEINGAKVQIKGKPFKTEQGSIYLPISEMNNIYDIEYNYFENYKNIVVDSLSKKLKKAYVTKNISVKENADVFSANIEKVKKGNWVVYIEAEPDTIENNWAKIRTQNGNLGYIKSKYLTNFVVEREEMDQQSQNSKEEFAKKDITNKNIKNYKNRAKLIQQILEEMVIKNQRKIKIMYKKDNNTEAFQRFKIEATAMLKECGITVIFEE